MIYKNAEWCICHKICFRWGNEAQMLSESLENVVGDVLIAAAFIAYLGAFTVEYRQVIYHTPLRFIFCNATP